MYSERSIYKRQFNQTFNESGDTSDAKVQHTNHSYSSNNNFQRGGRGTYNRGRGRGYHGNSSSFRGGYNQRGYYGGGHSERGMQHFKIVFIIFIYL